MNTLEVMKDLHGEPIYSSYGGYSLGQESFSYAIKMTADTEVTFTVPEFVDVCRVKYSDNFFLGTEGTLALPTGSMAAYKGELCPEVFIVIPGQTLHIIAESTPFLNFLFYKLNVL